MAGSIFTSFGAGDANATAFMTHLTAMTKGYNALSLTNMTNTTVPAIAAGSLIENNGALFRFDAEEAISTTDPVTSSTVADGTVYIMLIPSGSSITAAFTATAPTWSDSKQGWYGTTTYANNRYLPVKTVKASSSYTKSILYADQILTAGISPVSGTTTLSGNVVYTGSASFGAGSIAGFLDDGTPIYQKTITSMTYASGSNVLSASHGISNAYTNKRIISVSFSRYGSSLGRQYFFDDSAESFKYTAAKMITWTDTALNITLYSTLTPAGTMTDIYASIIYK